LMVTTEVLIALTHKNFVRLLESSTALETVWAEAVVSMVNAPADQVIVELIVLYRQSASIEINSKQLRKLMIS